MYLMKAIMGGAAAGAMDANAFNAAVRSDGSPLPELSTLTYQGEQIKLFQTMSKPIIEVGERFLRPSCETCNISMG